MMAVACVAALDPDYPLPRFIPTSASAVGGLHLLPVPLAPRGVVDAATVRFRWAWPGARDTAFDFVLLDEQHDEIYRRAVRGTECVVDGDLRRLLASESVGDQFHWFVVAHGDDRDARSAPMAFGISH